MTQRSRGFTCTDFECNSEFWNEFFVNEKLTYLICGLEICQTTSRYHFQIYMHFENARTLNSVIKKLKPRHVEIARGTPEQNKTYCSKEGRFSEMGKLPEQGERTDLEGIRDLLKKGASDLEIADTNFGKWVQYRKGFDAYKKLLIPRRNWLTQVIIFQGPPGSGKTRKAYERFPDIVPISLSGEVDNPFIGGYSGEPHVLLDDFGPHRASREFMLKLCDRYPLVLNIKGGDIQCGIRVIVITTNTDATQWYSQDGAWRRRISEIENFEKISELPKFDTEVLTGNTGP